jgi:phosphatidylserine decarboxylase
MADRAKDIPVAKEGIPFIAMGGILTLGAWAMGGVWSTCLLGTGTLFTAWFFRNPARTIPSGENLIVSPGDGILMYLTFTLIECPLPESFRIWSTNQGNL